MYSFIYRPRDGVRWFLHLGWWGLVCALAETVVGTWSWARWPEKEHGGGSIHHPAIIGINQSMHIKIKVSIKDKDRRSCDSTFVRSVRVRNSGSPDGGRAGTSSTPGDGSTAVLC